MQQSSFPPNELLEMNKASLLAVVMHQGSVISHVSIMAKSMEVPTLVEVEIQKEWDGHMAIVDGYTGICRVPVMLLPENVWRQKMIVQT